MPRLFRSLRMLTFLVVLSLSLLPWTPLQAGETVSEAQLRAQLESLDSDNKLDEALREQLRGLYRSALGHLEVARAESARIESLRKDFADPDGLFRQFQRDYENVQALVREVMTQVKQSSVEVSALESLRSRMAVEGTTLRNRLTALQDRNSALSDPTRLREELIARRGELASLTDEQARNSEQSGSPELAEALRLRNQLAQQAKSAEIERIEQELSTQPPRLKLAQQKLSWLEAEYQAWEEAAAALDKRLQELREDDVESVQRGVEQLVEKVAVEHPLIRNIADKSSAYVKEWRGLVRSEKDVARELAETRALLDRTKEEEKRIRERIESFGLSNVLGKILRRQRAGLPDIKTYEQRSEAHQQFISDASLGQYQTQQARRDLTAEMSRADETADQITLDTDGDNVQKIRDQLDALLEQQNGLLARVDSAYDSYLNELSALSLTESQLIKKTREYSNFLDEQLIWIPSALPLGWRTPVQSIADLAYYLDPANWFSAINALTQTFLRSPLMFVLLALGLFFLWVLRKPLMFHGDEHRQRIGKRYSDKFHYSLEALLLAAVNALPFPALLWFLGKQLRQFYHSSDFAHGLGQGLGAVTLTLFMLMLFLQLARPQGFFERHLQWSIAGLRIVRRHFWWFIPIYLLAKFFVASSNAFSQEFGNTSVEQVAFMTLSIALSLLFLRLANPVGEVTQPVYLRWPNGWFFRLRYVWYVFLVGSPFILAVIAGMGYLYTAQHFLERFIWTVWMFLGALIVYDIGRRGLALEQNKLALKVAREQAQEQRAVSEDGAELSVENDPLDLNKIDLQSRQMLLTFISWGVIFGLWFIWSGSLPALTALDEVVLWSHSIDVGGETQLDPISLADLMLALILGFVISMASKNLPGVLEIMVLHHLPLDAGSRYAITTIVRYVIIFIGALVIFGMVGFDWSQMQWLVAALGVGLGFGLQEIFANFVSGLIILFERPVRVGDAVTVSDLSGVVSKIRMRATTITDWDRKEIIVPNKSFITEKLVNWSLSDSVTRVKVAIGIAYGSDTKKAYEIIQSVARKNKFVLSDPSPRLFFMGFGESSLDFVLFVYVDNLDNRWNAAHELHMEINDAFASEGIEIPFPQRDIHIRSVVNGVDLFGGEG